MSDLSVYQHLSTRDVFAMVRHGNAEAFLLWAVEANRKYLVKKIIHHFRDLALEAAMCRAVDLGHDTLAMVLINRGANIHANNNHVLTVLARDPVRFRPFVRDVQNWSNQILPDFLINTTSEAENVALMQQLILLGCRFPKRVLRTVIQNGHYQTMKMILEVESKPDSDLLIVAAENGHLDLVKLLVEAGCSYHAERGRCFRWAARYGHLEVVKYFLQLDSSLINYKISALVLAAENGHTEIVRYLLPHVTNMVDIDTAYVGASKIGNLEIIQLLPKVDIVFQTEGYIWAAMKGYLPIIQHLAITGFDLKVLDGIAICYSAKYGRLDILKFLYNQGLKIQNITECHNDVAEYVHAKQFIHANFSAFQILVAKVYVATHHDIPSADMIPEEIVQLLQAAKM